MRPQRYGEDLKKASPILSSTRSHTKTPLTLVEFDLRLPVKFVLRFAYVDQVAQIVVWPIGNRNKLDGVLQSSKLLINFGLFIC